jgi:hypothetical protein
MDDLEQELKELEEQEKIQKGGKKKIIIVEDKKNFKQNTGLKRDTTDKYYTKNEVVINCKDAIIKYVNIKKNDIIIEPSAGNGSFIDMIKGMTNNYYFYDIMPENDKITKQDFLKFDYTNIKALNKKIHIIGNPPFGRQSSLAIQFIKKCCEFADSISFILPKSFKKESNKAKFDLHYHLKYEIDLPENSFTVNDKDCDVPCIFQIWIKKNITRIKPDKIEPNNFIFVNKEDNHDISFRRVGVYAGNIDKNTKDKSFQSHYFIKFTNDKTIDENINLLKKIKFDFNNTVGPKSISKQELIKEFNKYI